MYQMKNITGASLTDKTLCLTFDDGPGETMGAGPGPRTLEVARYLSEARVRATFFMVGKFASDLPEVMAELESLGHLIGNHTYDHPNMPDYVAQGGDPVIQLARTDGIIRKWIDAPVTYFRPPYGEWSEAIANALNGHLTTSLSHIGPVSWDIDASDWKYWMDRREPLQCKEAYLNEINNKGHGIVLMHDCTADIEVVKTRNRALELVKLLIPDLLERGYRFARIDEVPDVAALAQNFVRLALKGYNGNYVSPQNGGGGNIFVNGPRVGLWEPLIVRDLNFDKVAIQACNGQYISPQGGGGREVLANGPAVGLWETLDLISLGQNQVAFRCSTGHFLTCDMSAGEPATLKALRPVSIAPENVFTYEYPC